MSDKDSNLPEVDRPELGTDEIRRSEGLGSRRRGDHTGPGSGGVGRRRQRGDHPGSGGGGSARQRGDQHAGPSPAAPSDQEGESEEPYESAYEEPDESWYNDDGSPKKGWRRRVFRKYWKRGALGGGIAGLSIFGIVLLSSVSQGPLEFIHLAQLLEKFHFSSLEDAQNNRLESIARYIHDPSKPQNTRLGLVGNIAADHLESKMNDATGLQSEYNSASGRFEGYSVIRDNPNWDGMSSQQIKEDIINKYGLDPSTVSIDTINGSDRILVNPDPGGWNPVSRYRAQTGFSRELMGEAGYADIPSYVGSRVLGARAGWTFHPIKALDAEIQAKILEGGKAALDKIKGQLNQSEANYEANGATDVPGGEPKAQETNDGHGHVHTDPQAQAEAQGASDLQAQAKKLNPLDPSTYSSFTSNLDAKAAGSIGVAGIGIACVVRNLSASIGSEVFTKVILPMMRKAGKVFSLGSQAMSGQDIDPLQLGLYKNFLDTINPAGKVTSSWNQAQSIEAELGEPQVGPDLPTSDQVFNGNSNPFDIFDHVPLLGQACGALNSVFGQIFSIVTGPVSYVVSTIALQHIIPALADWLSGSPISPVASGALFGNIVNYGARLSANDQFASVGGVPLSSGATVGLKSVDDKLDQKDFQSKSLAYRLFNTGDSRTLASRLMDNQDLTLPQNVSSLVSDFGSIFKAAIKAPAMMLSGVSHAADQPYDYHGLKQVGFTSQELGDPKFDNPFDNACYVAGNCKLSNGGHISKGILDGSNGQSYISLAQKCFGVNITKSGNAWATDSLTQAVNFQSNDYPSNDCESGNQNWTRIRFWLLDTSTMEGYACSQGEDEQSCKDLGLDTGTSTGGGTSSPVNPPSGNAQQLAQQILGNNNIDLSSYSSSVLQDVKDAAAGKPGTAGAMTSAALLQLIATIGQNHKVMITAIQSDGQGHCNDTPKSACPTDPHYNGDAVDFGSLDGVSITGRNAPALTIIKIAEGVLPKGSGFGQQGCPGTQVSMPPGFTQFGDTCNHLHVQVPKGTP